MSGHSKWSKIKRKKGVNDTKRGALFTKIAKNITLAAKEGGGDPDMNFSLRLAVDKAKIANMPSDNIDRAIMKGTGEGEEFALQRISYEAFGPEGSMMIIDCQTDNTNRTVSEVRNIVESAGSKMGSLGSVTWKFVEKGLITVVPAKLVKSEKYGQDDTYGDADIDEIQMELMEIEGVEDIQEAVSEEEDGSEYNVLEVITDKVDFSKVLKIIERKEIKVDNAQLVKEATEQITLNEKQYKKVESLIESLDEHDDVDSVWTDVNVE